MKCTMEIGNTNWKVGVNFFCLCLTDEVELVVGKPFKGKKENWYCLWTSCWVLNCTTVFNVQLRNVCNECVCLCVAATLLNPDTHAKDCCAVTGMGANATWRVYLCTSQTLVLVGSLSLIQIMLLPKPKLTRDQGLISESTVLVQSYANRNYCQGSDSFSASETPLLDSGLANAYAL